MKTPLVSVVVVNWNGGKVFKDCLESLKKIDYPNWELIVVDNGSSDESLEYLRGFKKIKLLKNSRNLGFALANNQGYELSKGEFVLLLNNDTKVTPRFLSILVEKMADPTIGVLQPKIRIMDNPKLLDNTGSFLTVIGFLKHIGFMKEDGLEYSHEYQILSAKGACMLIRKSVIEKVDLFDPDFVSYFEESDFCWRVWLAGYRVLYFPQAEILHKVGFTIKRLNVANINYHYYKNRVCSLIKNLGLARLMVVLPLHIFVSLFVALAFFVRGQPGSACLITKALAWNLVSIRRTLIKRSRIQKERKVGDAMIFSTLSRGVDLAGFYNDFKRIEKDIKE